MNNLYKTKQRQVILQYIIENKEHHLTVNQIAEYLTKNNTPVSMTTIYRHLEQLLEQGLVRKYTIDSTTGACFQYANQDKKCYEHFHLKCEKCGHLIHLECNHLNELYQHIYHNHQFRINPFNTVIYGLCNNCIKKQNNLTSGE